MANRPIDYDARLAALNEQIEGIDSSFGKGVTDRFQTITGLPDYRPNPVDIAMAPGHAYDSLVAAPFRAGIQAGMNDENPLAAAYAQIAEDPSKAPSFGLVGDIAADPLLLGAAAAKLTPKLAARLAALGEVGALGDYKVPQGGKPGSYLQLVKNEEGALTEKIPSVDYGARPDRVPVAPEQANAVAPGEMQIAYKRPDYDTSELERIAANASKMTDAELAAAMNQIEDARYATSYGGMQDNEIGNFEQALSAHDAAKSAAGRERLNRGELDAEIATLRKPVDGRRKIPEGGEYPIAGKIEKLESAEKLGIPVEQMEKLDRFAARFPEDDVKTIKQVYAGQKADGQPYFQKIEKMGSSVPNFAAKPTKDGVIGASGKMLGDDHLVHDPFAWREQKYGATKDLLQKYGKRPVTINTASDLVAHKDYMDVIPKGSTVNMNLIRGREKDPALPSVQRQLRAAAALKSRGFQVNIVVPNGMGKEEQALFKKFQKNWHEFID